MVYKYELNHNKSCITFSSISYVFFISKCLLSDTTVVFFRHLFISISASIYYISLLYSLVCDRYFYHPYRRLILKFLLKLARKLDKIQSPAARFFMEIYSQHVNRLEKTEYSYSISTISDIFCKNLHIRIWQKKYLILCWRVSV